MRRERAQALIVQSNPLATEQRKRIAELAMEYRLPAMYEIRQIRLEGDLSGLISYGPSIEDQHRRAAVYIDRIFKGAKPADLPVEQPTKFEMVIDLKTAKALRLAIPQTLLLQADEVIQ